PDAGTAVTPKRTTSVLMSRRSPHRVRLPKPWLRWLLPVKCLKNLVAIQSSRPNAIWPTLLPPSNHHQNPNPSKAMRITWVTRCGDRRDTKAHHQRSDVTAVPASGAVAEAMVALVVAGEVLEKFGGDSVIETQRNMANFIAAIEPLPEPESEQGHEDHLGDPL